MAWAGVATVAGANVAGPHRCLPAALRASCGSPLPGACILEPLSPGKPAPIPASATQTRNVRNALRRSSLYDVKTVFALDS